MKLQLTLPETPGLMHVLPGLDLLALVLLLPLLSSSFLKQSGMDVTVHESPWRYEQMENPIVVTLGAASKNGITPVWVNKVQISMENLEVEVQKVLSQDKEGLTTTAVLRSDVSVPSGLEKEVIIRIQKMGLHCGLVGKPVGKN